MDASPHMVGSRYVLGAPLGEGAMGVVSRAVDRLTGQGVALKQVTLPPDLRPEDVEHELLRLAHEFQLLAGLRHPHIISVLDYGFDADRRPFYTMELLEGARTIIAYGRSLARSAQIDVLIQAAEALAYLHRRRVLHHDLKPENILVADDRVRLLDFGLAVIARQQRDDDAFGTLLYLAPEVLDGQPYTESADLYSLGVIAYELLLGAHPFHADHVEAFFDRVFTVAPDLAPLAAEHPALAAIVAQLLAKDPAERLPSAHACIERLVAAAGRAERMGDPAVRESYLQAATFVGREPELAALASALAQARQGQGSAWLIAGESGVGKSRLLQEVRTQALVGGALVIHGQAVEGGGLPYQLWHEPLRRLALSGPLSDLEAGILKPIVPDIGSLLEREIPEAPELQGEAGRQRLSLTILDLFRRQRQPVVLLVEDLQWSSESLQPLARLVAVAGELPLLIVGNYRSDERPQLPDELPGAQLIPLERLNAAEVAELSAAMLGDAGRDPVIVERLRQETEGNTFFMVEVVRALAEAVGRLSDVTRISLPRSIMAGGVQKLIRRRLERVPPWGRDLLALTAITGRQIDLAVTRALIQAEPHLLGAGSLDIWLRACADVSVLETLEDRWRFAHDKLREQIIADLPPETKPLRHRAVAAAIEHVYASDAARKPYREILLAHWREAADVERELDYLTQVVGELIAIRADHLRAEELIARGLGLLAEADPRRATLLNSQAESAWRRGDYEAAEAGARAAHALAERLAVHEEEIRSLNALGIIAERRGDYEAAMASYQQSLALSRQVGDSRSAARAMLGVGSLNYFLGRVEAAERSTQEGVALGRELGDAPGVATGLNNLGVFAQQRGEYQAASAYFQQSAAQYREAGHREGAALTLNNLGDVAGILGDYRTAEGYFHESLAIYRAIGDQRGTAMVLNGLGNVASCMRDFDAAEQYLQQSAAIYREISSRSGLADVLESLGRVAADRRDPAAAEAYFAQSLALAREISYLVVVAVNLSNRCRLALDGGLPRLLDELCEGLALSLEIRAQSVMVALLVTAALRALRAGQGDSAAQLAGLLDAHPATPQDLRDGRLAPLLAELRALLPADALAARLGEGARLDLEETARAWLARLERERAEIFT